MRKAQELREHHGAEETELRAMVRLLTRAAMETRVVRSGLWAKTSWGAYSSLYHPEAPAMFPRQLWTRKGARNDQRKLLSGWGCTF